MNLPRTPSKRRTVTVVPGGLVIIHELKGADTGKGTLRRMLTLSSGLGFRFGSRDCSLEIWEVRVTGLRERVSSRIRLRHGKVQCF